MPRKDQIHDAVRNTLIKDGWTITDDPFRIVFEDTDVCADLRITKIDDGTITRRALVIEIKGFSAESPMYNLKNALGQCALYRIYLQRVAPDDKLYLDIDSITYEEQFQRPSFSYVVNEMNLRLLVIDTTREEIAQWIN